MNCVESVGSRRLTAEQECYSEETSVAGEPSKPNGSTRRSHHVDASQLATPSDKPVNSRPQITQRDGRGAREAHRIASKLMDGRGHQSIHEGTTASSAEPSLHAQSDAG